MSDAYPTQVEDLDPSVTAALDMLASALRGRPIPLRSLRAAGPRPSPAEGLALVEDFIAIEDAELRQAMLDLVAALAG